MRQARWNWHDRVVGTLLFVATFLAATLIGSPRSHDRRIDTRRNSVYSRTSAGSDEQPNNIDEYVTRELEDTEFEEKPREFHPEPLETEHDVSTLEKPNATYCAVILLKKHPELCEVVDEILEVQALLPRLRRVVTRRMGGRRANFVYEIVREKTAIQHLYETVKCMEICIKKFVKFVGTVERLIRRTTPESIKVTGAVMTDPFPDIEMDTNRSYNRWAASMRKDYKDPANLSFPAPHLNPSGGRYTRRGSPKNCIASVMKVDSDVCGTLTKMELLDSILVTPGETIIEDKPIEDSELPLELDGENLVLGRLLDAVADSLADARGAATEVVSTEEARRDRESRNKTWSRERKLIPNGNNDEPHDDHRNLGDADQTWNAKKFIVERNEVPQARGFLRKYVRSERDQSPSTHSSRSLGENFTSGNMDKGQEAMKNILKNRRGGWKGPYYPDRKTPRKNYPHYRVGDPDPEHLSNEKNKEECEVKEAEDGDWKEWLFSKVREVSKKAFGA